MGRVSIWAETGWSASAYGLRQGGARQYIIWAETRWGASASMGFPARLDDRSGLTLK